MAVGHRIHSEDLSIRNHAGDEVSSDSPLPGISIIIPVINEEDAIGRALEERESRAVSASVDETRRRLAS